MLAAIRDPDPVVFLEPTRLYRLLREPVVDDGTALPLGQAFVLRPGSDLHPGQLGCGRSRNPAGGRHAGWPGIEAEVIDMATLKPLDMDTVLASGAPVPGGW